MTIVEKLKMADPQDPTGQNNPPTHLSSEEVPVSQAPSGQVDIQPGGYVQPSVIQGAQSQSGPEQFVINDPIAITSSSALPEPPPPVPASPKPTNQTPASDGGGGKKGLIIALAVFLALGVLGGVVFGISKFMVSDKKQENVELSWWGLWEDAATVAPLIEDYQAKNSGVTIKYTKQSPQDYRQRLTSSLAKEQGPDIFRFHNTWLPMLKTELSDVPADVMSRESLSREFYPVMERDLVRNGQVAGIPLMTDGLGLYINEDIFEKNNLAPPATWQELRDAATLLTQRDSEGRIVQAGVALGTVNNVDNWEDVLALMFLQNNADMESPGDKRAEDALLFYTVFTTTDKVWDSTLPPSTLAFSSGKVAMYFGPSWRVFEIKNQNPNLKFKIVPVPQLPKSSPDEKDITWANYWAEGVWERSAIKEAAFRFLKFMSEREQMEKLYNNAAQTRLFGEIPSRQDMAGSRLEDPYVGAYIKQAEFAQSWYLAGRTYDGDTGINTRIAKYYEDAVNSTIQGRTFEQTLDTLVQGVQQVLKEYGIQ